jgi:23S rRNA (cytosine1962-C5)-methyltransferase
MGPSKKEQNHKGIILKPGREKSVLARHPWIFSGGIHSFPQCEEGQVLQVYSSDGKLLGSGMCNHKSQIACRMLTFGNKSVEQEVTDKILAAIYLRKQLFEGQKTTAYRLINAEGDGLSGLIVDKYDSSLVLQISSAGIEKLKPLIVNTLISALNPTWIYEKSTSPSRKEEGLKPSEQTLYGTPLENVQIQENGCLFNVSIMHGQKTGFFLDQREMRALIKNFAKDKRVLNTFSYTGAFSVAALAGGAECVDSVDISKDALSKVQEHIDLNNFSTKTHNEYAEDAFDYLKSSPMKYDLVILDPPAFAKRKSDINQAARAYKEINRQALLKMPANSYLLTCSCSYHIDELLFQKILFSAALEAKRDVRIICRHIMASDHPMSIYHPEGSYLKSLFCYVS